MKPASATNPLDAFQETKATLLLFARRLRTAALAAGDDKAAAVVDDFTARFADTRFLVFVAGDFKSGKSTLVNALVGRDICPVRATPRTAKVTRLAALGPEATEEQVVVTYRKDRPADSRKLAETNLDDVVAVRGKETGEVDRVDIFIRPGDTLLRHPLRLVDTPGLGSSHAEHTAETRSYLEHADVLLFVFTASKPLSDAERMFLLENRSRLDRFVFAVNQIDRVGDEAKDVVDYVAEGLRTQVFPEGARPPELFPVSGQLALSAESEGEADASGVPALVRAIETHLAQTHVAKLVKDVAQQQVQLALSLEAQMSLAEEVLHSSRASGDALKPQLGSLWKELEGLASAAKSIQAGVAKLPEDTGPSRSARVEQVRTNVVRRLDSWLAKCPSEDVCRRDLPAVAAKTLTDEVESIELDLRTNLDTLAQTKLKDLGAVFRKMEEQTRKTLTPKARVDASSVGAFAKGAAAMQALGAFAQQVGGPTGGYGATAAALKTALAPSMEVRFLSVTAAVSLLVAMFGGPAGWLFAGVASFLATVFGFSRAATWRQRVLANVEKNFDEMVIPKLLAALEETISVAAADLAGEIDARTDVVLGRFRTLIQEVRKDLDLQTQKQQEELARLSAGKSELRSLQAELSAFLRLTAAEPPSAEPKDAQRDVLA